ncbi:L,D-transpeptidase [Ulvibacterium marinum]|uniref:Murein L,D-transpeptidase n=1 Tax=Ulvibacterium marinum TaxID=2419782 RepID=A0A3B0C3E4_9FLAO|nr:L,D-transpeptidase [Ulvibacterium marinum]RKN80232.1 murein L,D-transpeptidase [Ulvibacterium marinum]
MSNCLKLMIILGLLLRVALLGTISKDGFVMAYDFLETVRKQNSSKQIYIKDTVRIRGYFSFMDSLVATYDDLTEYPISEHLLVRANPWIIDTLANTDYYRMSARDSFVYDQKQLIVLPKGNVLKVPDSLMACNLLQNFENTSIDVNIPEFKLRIYQDSELLYTFPIRVGQNRKRYLVMGDRRTDLRTKRGKGVIIKHVRDPDFYNPVDGKRFYLTKRDDEKTTLMPQIPWLETEINGNRNGQMIHPTTNPETLGKAYSNGCIGVKEADAWIIYYHAPIGTPITIRYDLKVKDENGNKKVLRDIYDYEQFR